EPGQEVTVHFDIRGNEYKDRFFVNLNAWRVEGGTASASKSAPSASHDDAPIDTDVPESAGEDEDYPF
nr:DUF3127 domain-containing protein [Kiritimatiellia bacterium]